MPAHTPIPDIPGELLTDPTLQYFLAERVSNLCGIGGGKFPGSQPVSFSSSSLDLLEKEDFWVCEKSDGVRVLVFIVVNQSTEQQEVWLIDRKQRFFKIQGLYFAHWENRSAFLGETLLDGELVIDIDPISGAQTLMYYAFDCMVLHGENIMEKPLLKRYARLHDWVIKPFATALSANPDMRRTIPFMMVAKREELSYHLRFVMEEHIPKLKHGHDGLIFTCVHTPYVAGTDENILKWKPPSENSIDFKVELRFPPLADSDEPDYRAKPEFLLNTWLGGDRYEFFDFMAMTDDEWQRFKESEEQLDERIVEVCWDSQIQAWKMLRMRDDKPHGNHKSIVDKILVSINDGVEIEELYARADTIKAAWKERAKQRSQQQPPQNQRPPPQACGQDLYTPGHGYAHTGYNPDHSHPPPQQGIMSGLRR
ncbi:mRNA guanylyltransferase [Cryptococcus neoformans A2-102-5]|nr:mRNA guanylyltransferase [Cryptococcus neoformans var. grubii D17-1]OXG98933.1 mRNA guanylyltransferase [Cryptococcus neoformans var. grubii A2-102-5]